MRTWLAIFTAAALSGGCALVPHPDAAVDEVFRNAVGEPIELPWEWAGAPVTPGGVP